MSNNTTNWPTFIKCGLLYVFVSSTEVEFLPTATIPLLSDYILCQISSTSKITNPWPPILSSFRFDLYCAGCTINTCQILNRWQIPTAKWNVGLYRLTTHWCKCAGAAINYGWICSVCSEHVQRWYCSNLLFNRRSHWLKEKVEPDVH